MYPQLADTYGKATPWVAPQNGPITFFENPISTTNSFVISKGDKNGSFRLSYSNLDASGLLPNSSQKKNTLSLSATSQITDRFRTTAYVAYSNAKTLGRNSTGYSDNIAGFMRQ